MNTSFHVCKLSISMCASGAVTPGLRALKTVSLGNASWQTLSLPCSPVHTTLGYARRPRTELPVLSPPSLHRRRDGKAESAHSRARTRAPRSTGAGTETRGTGVACGRGRRKLRRRAACEGPGKPQETLREAARNQRRRRSHFREPGRRKEGPEAGGGNRSRRRQRRLLPSAVFRPPCTKPATDGLLLVRDPGGSGGGK